MECVRRYLTRAKGAHKLYHRQRARKRAVRDAAGVPEWGFGVAPDHESPGEDWSDSRRNRFATAQGLMVSAAPSSRST